MQFGKSRSRKVVSEMLEETVNRYTNRSLTTAEIIAELVKLAKQMRDAQKRHEELGLREDLFLYMLYSIYVV
ncbi:type I restriction enzyme endonuclease domain-containing protein [Streptomyces sp. NPDC013489]|uniref:type I restriction enzyme endonuclease domain-containing protein n=1 Tax=Streptomyces sp. NPDC013489 TaxID=3155606 RepID=UPI0033F1BD47